MGGRRGGRESREGGGVGESMGESVCGREKSECGRERVWEGERVSVGESLGGERVSVGERESECGRERGSGRGCGR